MHPKDMSFLLLKFSGYIMGGLTTISLGALVVFHLAFGLGNLLKVLQSLERLLTDFN